MGIRGLPAAVVTSKRPSVPCSDCADGPGSLHYPSDLRRDKGMTVERSSSSGIFGAVRTWLINDVLRGPVTEPRKPVSQSDLSRSAAEILIIAIWASWVGRVYLDFNPYTWPV